MSDEQYALPRHPPPEPTAPVQHPRERRRANIAICIAVAAAFGSTWQAWEVRETRKAGKQASDAQALDVERSRKAAEDSAAAAKKLADGMERSAKAAELSAEAGRNSLSLNTRALRLSESPFLETLGTKFLKPFPTDPVVSIQTETANNGKGPAYNINIHQGIQIAQTWVFSFKETSLSYTDVLGLPSSRRPTITVSTVMKQSLADAIVNDIKQRHLYLYVYGWVEYEARIFDKPEKREPYTYCYYYAVPLEHSSGEPFAECPQQPAFAH
jgi:hypothetical protein